uniref:Down syndrome cell adhesion molecule n=1 Tax=Timema monikensis TaxID=170555 RepID=A0A7R9E8D9_9NEOP|nr:unnamed protein product [Timema monikensis]
MSPFGLAGSSRHSYPALIVLLSDLIAHTRFLTYTWIRCPRVICVIFALASCNAPPSQPYFDSNDGVHTGREVWRQIGVIVASKLVKRVSAKRGGDATAQRSVSPCEDIEQCTRAARITVTGPIPVGQDRKIKDFIDCYAYAEISHLLFKFGDFPLSQPSPLLYSCKGSSYVESTPLKVPSALVPEAPDNIKVVAGSTNSLVVGWLTPSRPNGRITSYTVYQRTLEGGREKDSNKRRLPPTQTHYEVHDLLKGEAHEFWVTAFTRIGEGQSTPVVYATVTTRVPAAIISFGHTMSVRRRGSVQMPCLAVGIPLPERHWFNVEGIHLAGDPFTIQSDGTLHIIEVQRQHQGNYTCSISNANGSDQITYFLRVLVAPSAPVVRVAATSSDWLQLQWSTTDNGGSAIRGYFLNFRKEEGGEWEERAIQRDATFFRLHKLDCGTQYQLQMMAYNAVGSGSPSSVVIAHTDGDIPIKPTYLDFIEVNTSNITLRLKSWGDNGCPIISYSIEYKESSQQDWLTAVELNTTSALANYATEAVDSAPEGLIGRIISTPLIDTFIYPSLFLSITLITMSKQHSPYHQKP